MTAEVIDIHEAREKPRDPAADLEQAYYASVRQYQKTLTTRDWWKMVSAYAAFMGEVWR